MQKLVLSVLGKDRPGIVARIASVLCSLCCNIEDCSQTILQTEFAGIFIVNNREGLSLETVTQALKEQLGASDLTVKVKPVADNSEGAAPDATEPFVVTTSAPDQMGMIAAISGVLAELSINIINFKAILRTDTEPDRLITIFEVDVPLAVPQGELKQQLSRLAQEYGLKFTVQHRAIFEATNKI